MNYNPAGIHHRRSIRLKGYDYAQPGLYFVTICTHDRLPLFGEIKDREIILNDSGKMVKTVWHEIPLYYNGFNVHKFVVMPNHVHGIVQIETKSKPVGAGPCACLGPCGCSINKSKQTNGQPQGVAPTISLSDIVHRFKTLTTKRYIDGVNNNEWPRFNNKLWQRNYGACPERSRGKHIIRNENSYNAFSEYIINNPSNWQEDTYYL